MLHSTSISGDRSTSILKALRSPAVKKPFQHCLTWNFPNLPDHRMLSFTLDTYFHPEKVPFKGAQRKHCLTPRQEENVGSVTNLHESNSGWMRSEQQQRRSKPIGRKSITDPGKGLGGASL